MVEVRIEKLVYGGEGLGRLAGRAVLVPLVLPGERVLAEPVKEEARLMRARLARLLEASPQRIAGDCPYFARCGGCHYQHAPYEDQLRYKAAILRETLQRIGKFDPPEAQLVPSEPWNYRNRTQFKTEKRGDAFRLGYFEMGSHRLLPVELCPISSPRINQALPQLWELGRRPDFPEGQGEIELFVGHDDSGVLMNVTAAAAWPETLVSAARERIADLASLAVFANAGRPVAVPRIYGRSHLVYRAGGIDYRVSHGSFFQTNRYLTNEMAELATADLEGDIALDLFSGVGYFALPLARKFRRVIAVESNPSAIRDLESNRSRAGASNVEPARATAEDFLRGQAAERLTPNAVLVDPPRAGLGKGAAERLGALGARTIVYVSCDPATLARDLARLLASGYRLERLHLVDLFPQTFHIESIARLSK